MTWLTQHLRIRQAATGYTARVVGLTATYATIVYEPGGPTPVGGRVTIARVALEKAWEPAAEPGWCVVRGEA